MLFAALLFQPLLARESLLASLFLFMQAPSMVAVVVTISHYHTSTRTPHANGA